MADQKISDLTAAEAATADDLVVIVDDPSGTPVTKKLTIAELATAVAGDKLPLAGGTMTGAIVFGTGGQNINVGSFDNGSGGSSGISLVCAVGYELNWQGGHLSSSTSAGATNYDILCDSSITLAAGKRLTFGDGTYLESKLPVIVDEGTGSGDMPTDAAACDIVDCVFNGTSMLQNPTNSADGKTILWRIARTGGAQTVTLDSDFVIVSGTIDNTEHMVTFVRATYSVAAGEKWYANVTNVEYIPPAVSILLRMDGADGSTTFTDSSANALTVTANGGTTISTSQSKFGGASAYFTGNPVSYLTTDDSPLFGFGTGDFTIEMWVQLVAGSGRFGALSIGDYTNGILWRMTPVGGPLYFAGTALNLFPANPAGVPIDGAWHHVAITRQGTVARGFLDGGLDFETDVGVIDLGASRVLMVGCGSHELNSFEAFKGYIDNVKITKGEAVYTAAFTPSTASLLLNMDASPFVDSSPAGRAITMNGSVTLGAPKYGAGSCSFGGGAACLSMTMDDTNWDMDWTIEFWMNATVVGNYGTSVAIGNLGSGVGGIHVYMVGNQLAWSDGFSAFLQAGSVTEGVWTHVALVRLSGVNYFYQDGALIASGERTFPVVDTVATIGSAPNYYFGLIGAMDDVRIVKGQALYAGNFTPPAGPLV